MKLTRRRSMLLLALSLGVAVAIAAGVQGAAGAPASMHVKVTGKDFASQLSLEPLPGRAGVSGRSEVWGGREETSDPRVSGRYGSAFGVWEYSDYRAHFTDGTYALTNARGQWKGTFYGVRGPDGSHYLFGTHEGRGAYRGLRYRTVVYDKASGTSGSHLFDIDGWIERATTPVQQAASGPGHIKVTGNAWSTELKPSSETRSGSVRIYRNGLWGGTEKTSDPRTTGKYTVTMTSYEYPDGRAHLWGLYTLTNARGTWKGPWYGVRAKDGSHYIFVDATGNGAFRGLRYRYVDTDKASGDAGSHTFDLNGWIEFVK